MKFRSALLVLGVAAVAAAVGNPNVPEIQAAEASQAQLKLPEELRHASEFGRLLEQSGVPVQEVLRSRMEGTFGGVLSAAFVRTALGVAEIIVLPGATDAEQISITYTRNASTMVPHHYVLKGPLLRSEGQPTDAANPLYFTLHQNWFIMTLEPGLDDVLKRALKQTNRPHIRQISKAGYQPLQPSSGLGCSGNLKRRWEPLVAERRDVTRT